MLNITKSQRNLCILRRHLDGRSYNSICTELGWSREQVRWNMQATRKRLIRDLRIEPDIPQLFKPYKPGNYGRSQASVLVDTAI